MHKLKLQDDSYCFACGENNTAGLQLKFSLENGCLKTQFTPQKIHQGYTNIVHGGILGLILDEVMVNLLWKVSKPAVTAELNLQLKKPAKVGKTLFFTGSIVSENSRIVYTKAHAQNELGDIVAKATAKCIRVTP
ncbi:PaaI family thioesterase [Candidatus Omnitrophota bacterium]